ncbi:MAG: hypothetical protein O3A00_17205, partial [Planctomycetota bacterium]|nr:hypothetical protein [Planctomycetota bacterium]
AERVDGLYSLSVEQPHLVISALLERLQRDGFGLTTLSTRHATLEDVFVKLTGRRLDDENDAARIASTLERHEDDHA